ncbi:ribosome maturation factor RimM [Notoacmeibacter ruber]|uniref:ribosome maturation factor RimM n=1 Tax=Notoacmeibacter ruber TaxID=2670375 RepID=UPI001314A214|nr:ribosome maturation factor RimM [Notoacmeibacter ruber]
MAHEEEHVIVARVGAAHGIRGEVRIKSFTEEPAGFSSYGPLFAQDGRTFMIESVRPQKEMMIARLKGITSREQAEALNGLELSVPRSALGETDDADEFFLADLVGLTVTDSEDRALGTVVAVHDFGAGDILEIRFDDRGIEMVAFTRETVPTVDLEKGRLTFIAPMEVSERNAETDGR